VSDNPALPGTRVDLPLPPGLDRAFGCNGNARFVAFSWTPMGDEVVYEDGRSSGTGASWTFLAYRRHRSVAPLLEGFNLGYSDADADHALVTDREANRASIAPVAEARQLLRDQHPPEPPLTEEQRAGLERQVAEMVARGWHEVPVDPEQVRRSMEEQRQRVGRMMSWLEMAPVPESGEGRGA